MSAWIRSVVFGAVFGIALAVPVAAVEPPDPIELALQREDHALAEKLARERLADSEQRYGKDSAQAWLAIDVLVEALLDGDRIETPDLQALVAREIELARSVAGNESGRYARALARRAKWSLARFDDQAAIPLAKESAAVAARALAADDLDRAEIDLLAAVSLYYSQRRPEEGAALAAQAIERLARPPVRRPRAYADALRVDANIQISNQKKDSALRAARRYEAYIGKTFGQRSARYGEALTALGIALSESGEYAKGIEALERSAAILADSQPYRQRLHVEALRALGQRLSWMGDARYKAELSKALAIEEKHPTGNGFLAGSLLYALGVQSSREDDAEAAQEYLERAIPIYERVFGRDAPQAVRVTETYAGVLVLLGRLDEAAAIYERRIAAHTGNPSAFVGNRIALIYGNLAYTRLLQRRYAEAETLYRKSLSLIGEGRDFEQVNPRNYTTGLAAALWGQGRHRDALEQTRRVRASAFRVRNAAIEQLSERELLNFDYSLQDASEITVALATDSGDPALIEAAWQAVLETSGFVTRAVATRLAAASSQRTDSTLWQEWRTASTELSAARVAATKAPSAAAIAALDRKQAQLDHAERRIAAADGRASRALQAERSDLAAVVSNLPARTALVRFVEISDYAPDEYRRGKPGLRSHLYALMRTSGEPARAIDLGPVKSIAGRIDAWYAAASDPRGDLAALRDDARAIRRALIDPLVLPPATSHVFVVPSAAMSRLNFAALADDAGRYLAETGPSFHLLNNEREFLLARADGANGGVLLAGAASGGPTARTGFSFPAPMRKACPGLRPESLGALPGTADEIAALRELAGNRGGRVDVLSGTAATEAAVREAMPGRSILHFATHAFAFGDHCAGGDALRSIALDSPPADGKALDLASLPSLSALAFLPGSGTAGDDGLLTSEEVATLNLSAADWVVLSACETALGKVQGGEGVFGLRRAFRLAGARTVVMSLWKVEDEATAAFMRELYKARLVDGRDTPDAMQAAMRATLEARRRRGESVHPLYWAGFVAAGAWR